MTSGWSGNRSVTRREQIPGNSAPRFLRSDGSMPYFDFKVCRGGIGALFMPCLPLLASRRLPAGSGAGPPSAIRSGSGLRWRVGGRGDDFLHQGDVFLEVEAAGGGFL